jgi:hypothetical protein
MNWTPAELCTVGTYAGSEAVRQECFALIAETEIQTQNCGERAFRRDVVERKRARTLYA